MLILVEPGVRADHEELRELVGQAFRGVECDDVEVHVERATRRGESFSGRAYPEPPRKRLAPGFRYLVRLKVPGTLRDRGYPQTHRYVRLRTAPWITVGSWRERLVVLAAHEACHIRQFRARTRRSEVQAERWAAAVLQEWIAERSDAEALGLAASGQQLQLC